MNKRCISHLKRKGRGQAMVEFVIALPILLFILFGIIEFARMVFAWMAVQNAARFGIRYAVTGEFNELYCIQAGTYLGASHVAADTDSGDPQDCIVPDSYTGTDSNDLERELIDFARLFSIQDAAIGGGAGLWLRPNVSGNYEQYLTNHAEAFIGLPTEEGFYHVTICSNRNNQYAMDFSNYSIPLCLDMLAPELMDDAGGPGDRVKVHIEHQHPFFLPLLSNLWPSVTLTAERDGIVEKFRTSRVIGVSGPILSAPTWTQTPTITDTPSISPTPSDTPTETTTSTPTITETPIPVDCDLITVTDYREGNIGFIFRYIQMQIQNNNPVDIHLYRANQNWVKDIPLRILTSYQFHTSPILTVNDTSPPTIWTPGTPITVGPGVGANYVAYFTPGFIPLGGITSTDLEFDDGCHKIDGLNLPTATPSPTPTITPTPDCNDYSLGAFSFNNFAIQNLSVTNGDVVDAVVNQIQFNWNYAELLGATNGYNNLYVDWFAWNGSYFHLDGPGPPQDPHSPTNWTGGALPFNAGSSNNWSIDFNLDWGGGGPLTGVVSNDFGVIIDFANGCQLRRDPIPRGIITWTPSPTPSITWTPLPPPPATATALPPTPTATPLPSLTPTDTWTPSITPSATETLVPTITPSITDTVPVPTDTYTTVPSWTPIPPDTNTPIPTYTPSSTPVPTWTPRCPFDDPLWPCQPTWTPSP